LLNEIADLIDPGVIRSTTETVVGAINAASLKRAHALVEGGRGKLVLEGF
jgi:hypothetical protein